MIELFAMNAATGDKKDLTDAEKKAVNITTAVMAVIWLLFWFFAITRAVKCSAATPDSRAIHLMFATASPVLYLVLSFSVSGFCY